MTPGAGLASSRLSGLRALVTVPAVLFAFVAAALTVLGYQLDARGEVAYGFTLVASLALTPLYLLAYCIVFSWFEKREHDPIQKVDKRLLAACVCCIATVWLAWYFVLFPGVYGYDGAFCLLEWIDDDVELTSRWSVPFTWLYSFVVMSGRSMTGSYIGGFAVYSFLQMAFLVFCCARVVWAVMRRSAFVGPIATTAFFALNPLFPLIAVSSSQDALFMGLFALMVARIVGMLDVSEDRPTWRGVVVLMVVVLLFCLVRNNGIYAIVVALPFIAVFLWRSPVVRPLFLALCVPVVVALVVQGPVYDALGVTKSTTLQEMMSVPVMQLSRTYAHEGESLSDQDKAEILSYIPEDGIRWYDASSELSDAMKAVLDVERIQGDPMAFVSLYVRMGVAYPRDYFEATALGSLGLWYPAKSYPDSRMYHPYIESECLDARQYNPDYIDIPSASFAPAVDAVVNEQFGGSQNAESRGAERFSTVPVASLFLKPGAYLFASLAMVAFFLSGRRSNELAALALFAGVGFTVLLGPVVLFRYIAPMMFSFPLAVSWLACPIGGRGCAESDFDLRGVSSTEEVMTS
ncbi:MAG: hypothetical protein J6D25_06590 [Eggerthellaceae bacterium]|nr:hypothetical protein [Eggerthellaceae bacterium]